MHASRDVRCANGELAACNGGIARARLELAWVNGNVLAGKAERPHRPAEDDVTNRVVVGAHRELVRWAWKVARVWAKIACIASEVGSASAKVGGSMDKMA